MNERFYTIKSVSDEGVYILCKGWGSRSARAIWKRLQFSKEQNVTLNRVFALYRNEWFKTPQSAKTSLAKLLKVMDEYETDTFTIIEVNGFGDILSEMPA